MLSIVYHGYTVDTHLMDVCRIILTTIHSIPYHTLLYTRYMGVDVKDAVPFAILDGSAPEEVEAVSVQIHPQRPELGNRVMRRYNKVSDMYIYACVYGLVCILL